MDHPAPTAKPNRRWLKYSMRVLLVFVLLVSIPGGWVAVEMRQTRREREAAAAISKLGGILYWAEPSMPRWFRSLLGDDFSYVFLVNLSNSNVNDAGLESLKGFSKLHELDLEGTKVTDEGIKKLRQALPNCRICWGNSLTTMPRFGDAPDPPATNSARPPRSPADPPSP
jgi:hypothetical protein